MVSRRRILGASAVLCGAMLSERWLGDLIGGAMAQDSLSAAVERLEKKAKDAGIPVGPRISPEAEGVDEFNDLKERLLDVMDGAGKAGPATAGIAAEAGDLLTQLSQSETQTPRGPLAVRFEFKFNEETRAEYRRLFETCAIRDHRRPIVMRNAQRVLAEPRFSAYQEIQTRTGVPWYAVAAIHNLEASLNLKAHLHNGDSLLEKTRNVPKGRPKVWNPPTDWASSAVDALGYDGLARQNDWSLERMLYRLEFYNGLGSRRRGINTPYLWSYSQHYEKGKYVADHVWDSEAVSKQCGAVVLIKALIELGKIQPPPLWTMPMG